MTTIAYSSPFGEASTYPRAFAVERQARDVAVQVTALLLALLVPTVLALLSDGRLTHGINGWLKPIKFELSLALHFATLALLLGFMAPAARAGRLVRWSMLAAATMAVLEVSYIMFQAGRGRASHFNSDTRLEDVAYALMGLGAVTIVMATFVMGLMLWRHPRPGVSEAMRVAAGGGLMFSGLATLLIAGYMASTGSHAVGAAAAEPGSLPLLGWSTRGGDLRAPHFFATHAAQVVPLFALIWARAKGNAAAFPVAVFMALYGVFTLATLVQALSGLPFIPWR